MTDERWENLWRGHHASVYGVLNAGDAHHLTLHYCPGDYNLELTPGEFIPFG